MSQQETPTQDRLPNSEVADVRRPEATTISQVVMVLDLHKWSRPIGIRGQARPEYALDAATAVLAALLS